MNKPFLKWAGGKTQLLSVLSEKANIPFDKYIEPFIGAGALFFHLNHTPSVIADINTELINTYKVVRDDLDSLIEDLDIHVNEEQYYYQIRAVRPESLNPIKRASRFVFLNKTCFNGLYRVNKKGEFNVPFGKRKSVTICDTDVLRNASSCLQNTEILIGDFISVLGKHAEGGDLIFLDPPYYPLDGYADFNRYAKEFFYQEDHIRLKQEVDRLVSIGSKVIITNSNHQYIRELFKEYPQEVIQTKRSISSNANTRRGEDLIITAGY